MGKLFYAIKKMLGMTSLVLAFIGIFTPLFTIYVIWVSVGVAGLAGLTGSLIFSAAAFLLNIINLFFLSPISLALIGSNFFSLIVTLFVFIVSSAVWVFGLKLKMSGFAGKSEKQFNQHAGRVKAGGLNK